MSQREVEISLDEPVTEASGDLVSEGAGAGDAVSKDTTSGDSEGGGDDIAAGSGESDRLTGAGSESGEDPQDEGRLFVYVCGSVASPGVYEIEPDARVFEAIALAGGMSEEADTAAINQALSCHDGDMIYVPSKDETEGIPKNGGIVPGSTASGGGSSLVASSGVASGNSDDRIDINTADEKKLQELNGIGASRASDIVGYREKNGAFSSIEDIMKVPGIKQGTFDKIKDRIKV